MFNTLDEAEKTALRNTIHQKEIHIKNLIDRNEKLKRENLELTDLCIQSQLNRTVYVDLGIAKKNEITDLIEELEDDIRWVKDSAKDAEETLSRIKTIV